MRGLKAHLSKNSQISNPDLKQDDGQLHFRNCRFEKMQFQQGYFEGVVFEECVFEQTEASACSFDGIISDGVWWGEQKADPFTLFLAKVLELIGARCGSGSAAYREFQAYVNDYDLGKTRSKDFSAWLYNDRVTYADRQKFVNDLQRLEDSFPF